MKSVACASIALLTLACSAAAQLTVEKALKHLPDEPGIVIAFPSLKAFASNIAAFGKASGIEAIANVSYKRVLEEDGLVPNSAGVDISGAVLIHVDALNLTPVVICGLSDAAAWKTANKVSERSGGMLTFTDDHEIEHFAVIRENVLVVSTDEAAVEDCSAGSGAAARQVLQHAADALRQSQLVVFVNMPTWKAQLDQGVGVMDGMMAMALMSSPGGESSATMTRWMLQGAKKLVAEATVTMISLEVNEKSAQLRHMTEFQPSGAVAKYLKAIRTSEADPLRGLVDGSDLFYFATEWDLIGEARPLQEEMSLAMLDAAPEGPAKTALRQQLDRTTPILRKIKGYNGAVRKAKDGPGMVISGTYFTENDAELLESFPLVWESGMQMTAAAGVLEFAVDAKRDRVADVDAHVVGIRMKAEQPEFLKALEQFYGANPTVFAAKTPAGLSYTLGPQGESKLAFTELVKSATKLSENSRVAAAMKSIAPKPQVLALLDIAGIVEVFTELSSDADEADRPDGARADAAQAAGGKAGAEAVTAERSPYIVFAMYLDATKIRTHISLPAKSVRSVAESIASGVSGPGY